MPCWAGCVPGRAFRLVRVAAFVVSEFRGAFISARCCQSSFGGGCRVPRGLPSAFAVSLSWVRGYISIYSYFVQDFFCKKRKKIYVIGTAGNAARRRCFQCSAAPCLGVCRYRRATQSRAAVGFISSPRAAALR